ncbi:MAG: VOC family protein [Bermanella sp.]
MGNFQNLAEQFKSGSKVAERSKNPLIKVEGLAYQIVGRNNLDKAERFYHDFGLLTQEKTASQLILRGVGTSACLVVVRKQNKNEVLGFGLQAVSVADVDKVAKAHGMTSMKSQYPGGGTLVALSGPDDIEIEVIAGQKEDKGIKPAVQAFEYNSPLAKGRINRPLVTNIQPADIYRIGHTAFSFRNVVTSITWFQDNFGFIVSDFEFAKGLTKPTMAFMRCDQGDTPSDHHTLGIPNVPFTGHVHTAFELKNFEEVGSSGAWLREQGYEHSWGIGRHTLCSAVFDYWRDPWGSQYEHYTDCDVFDNTVPTGYHELHNKAQHQWGGDMPSDMLELSWKRAPATLYEAVTRLMFDKNFTFSILLKTLKAAGSEPSVEDGEKKAVVSSV